MSGRIFFCPACGARYDVGSDVVQEDSIVLLCGMCGHAARTNGDAPSGALSTSSAAFGSASEVRSSMAPSAPSPSTHSSAGGASLLEAQLPRVIVGHEVPASARSIATVLRRAGYSPACVRSGEQVLSACDPAMPSPPAAVVLDVAIPGVLAFEVIGQLRANPATEPLPVILLASVFERTRYKRRPTNLYGADAYVELHHVPDRLAAVIEEVRAKKAPAERARLPSRSPIGSGAVDTEAARSLARRLLSDVALEHGEELADGLRRGDPFAALTVAVDAARERFRSAIITGGVDASSPISNVFAEELTRFAARLLERRGHPTHSAPGQGGRRVDD